MKKDLTPEKIISLLEMSPLDVEGGMWKAAFRSDETLPAGTLAGREGDRALYGSILYLLTGRAVSRMHRLATDEIWHFYMGSPCETLVLRPDGSGYTERLGQDLAAGEKVTIMVPRGCWQGTRLAGDASDAGSTDGAGEEGDGCWALLGTTMAPGYEAADYEDGGEELLSRYPEFAEKILPLLARPDEEDKA